VNFIAGLDPGQRQDPAALVIVERVVLARDQPTDPVRFRWDVAPSNGRSGRRTRRL